MQAEDYKYWAFISYSHQDKKWGEWLHKSLETYRVPKRLIGAAGRDGAVPKRAFPVFRDREELPGSSDLGQNINVALQHSRYLIVICSPRSAQSIWVNEEIKSFKALGREGRVLCLIVDGEPNATDKPGVEAMECFPEAVRFRVSADGAVTDERTEPIAADAREGMDGKANAKLKLLAGILGVDYDALKQRDQARKMKRLQALTAVSLSLVGLISFLGFGFYVAKNEAWDRLKEIYRFRGNTAFMENKYDQTLLNLNEVRKIAPDDQRVSFELADSWRKLQALDHIVPGEEQKTTYLTFSREGKRLCAQDKYGRVRLVDLATNKHLLATASDIGLTQDRRASQGLQRIVGPTPYVDSEHPDWIGTKMSFFDEQGQEIGRGIPWPTDRFFPDMMTLSQQGKYLLTSQSQEDYLQLWNLGTEPATPSDIELSKGDAPGNYRWLFSADEKILLQIKDTGDGPFFVVCRDTISGDPVHRLDMPTRVAFIGLHGPLAVFGCYDGTLLLYRIETGELLWVDHSAHDSSISSISFSDDGATLLTTDSMGKMAVWNMSTESPVCTLQGRMPEVVTSADLSGDGRFAAIAFGHSVRVYDTQSGQVSSLFDSQNAPVSAVRFSPDQVRVAVATDRGDINLWRIDAPSQAPHVNTEFPEGTLELFHRIQQIGADTFLVYGNNLYVVTPDSGKAQEAPYPYDAGTIYLPDDNLAVHGWPGIYITTLDGERTITNVSSIDYASFSMLALVEHSPYTAFVHVQPGGKILAFDHHGKPLPASFPLEAANGAITHLFSRDATRGFVNFTDNRILEFRLDAEGIHEGIWHHPSLVGDTPFALLDFEEKSETLVLKKDEKIYFYNLQTDRVISLPGNNYSAVRCLTRFDQPAIATVNVNGTLELWDLSATLLAKNGIPKPANDAFSISPIGIEAGSMIVVSPDQKFIATSVTDRVYLWDVDSAQLLWRSESLFQPTPWGTNRLRIFSFSPDAQKLYVGIGDDQNDSPQFSGMLCLNLPKKMPSQNQVEDFLKSVMNLSL